MVFLTTSLEDSVVDVLGISNGSSICLTIGTSGESSLYHVSNRGSFVSIRVFEFLSSRPESILYAVSETTIFLGKTKGSFIILVIISDSFRAELSYITIKWIFTKQHKI